MLAERWKICEEFVPQGHKGLSFFKTTLFQDFRKNSQGIYRPSVPHSSQFFSSRLQSNIWSQLQCVTPILYLALFSVFSCFSSLPSSSTSVDPTIPQRGKFAKVRLSSHFNTPCTPHVDCKTGRGHHRHFAPLNWALCRDLLQRRDEDAVACLEHFYVLTRTRHKSCSVSNEEADDFFADEHRRAALDVAPYPQDQLHFTCYSRLTWTLQFQTNMQVTLVF